MSTHTHTDFILTYRDQAATEAATQAKKREEEGEGEGEGEDDGGELSEKDVKKRKKRETFLESCRELGLEFEEQDCDVRRGAGRGTDGGF